MGLAGEQRHENRGDGDGRHGRLYGRASGRDGGMGSALIRDASRFYQKTHVIRPIS